MGNNITIEKKRIVYDKLVEMYVNLKNKKISEDIIFEKLNYKLEQLLDSELPSVNLNDISMENVDGYVNTEKFTLIGWKNDDNDEELDILELEEILSDEDF